MTVDEKTQFVFETSKAARDRGMLSIWTVYDHPADFPDTIIARRFETGAGASGATKDFITGTLTEIRTAMDRCGLYRMPAAPADDENIIETWM